MKGPFVMINENRQAVVTGTKVHISTLKPRNKKKSLQKEVWPETDMRDSLKAFNVGLIWTLKGFIDDDLIRH